MNIKPETIFLILIAIIIILGIIWVIRTEKRLKRFFVGKKAKDLEDNIILLGEDISKLKSAREKIEKELLEVNEKLRKSIRGLEVVRFNPFPDQGSNQSFAVGMLNEDGDGVIFSSLYSRDRMSVFAKPVKEGKSAYELSNEEKEVLEKAKV